ncbi:hypothetical protein [uncultured Sphingomonas sp.]|uniref:hypothetical protein n=1 Tax=uncultured Sphingomonas sp. TaxID=158754 RepID=UPI0025D7818F|nr:hypothetical protein [uncultured Sphingomonas sp.]
MDFTKLDVGVQSLARQETAFPLELPEFKNGNGKPLSVTVLAFTSPEGRKELRKWQLRFGLLAKDHSAATEAQLDELAEKAVDGDVEMIARMVRAWNVEQADGKAVECSLENRMAFLRAFQPIADAIAGKVAALADELGNSKAA